MRKENEFRWRGRELRKRGDRIEERKKSERMKMRIIRIGGGGRGRGI